MVTLLLRAFGPSLSPPGRLRPMTLLMPKPLDSPECLLWPCCCCWGVGEPSLSDMETGVVVCTGELDLSAIRAVQHKTNNEKKDPLCRDETWARVGGCYKPY